MPGAVTVGQLIVNLSANTADLKSDLSSSTATVKQSAQEMTNAWAGVTASTGSVNAAGKALIATLKDQIATFGMSDQQLIQYKANLAGVGGEVQALNARLQGMKDASSAFGEEVGKAGGHTEQFSLSTAGARRELIVLAHEMSQGNYSKFGGSLLVLAEQTNAASLLFSAMGLTIGAVGAVVALTGYQLFKMHSEIDEFNKSLQLTGNFAGLTRDSLNSMAASIQSSATGGVKMATQVLEGLAATGHFTAGAMVATGQSALQFARLTGQSSEDVVKFFDGMSNGVTLWAENANKSYHFLNASQYEHIATLEKEGNSQQAVIETMKLMNAGLDENVKHLTYWQKNAKGWHDMLEALSESMRKFAFPTIDEKVSTEIGKLNELQAKLSRMTSSGSADSGMSDQIRADITKQRKVVHDLIAQSNQAEIDAAEKQARDLANMRAISAQKELDQIKTSLKSKDELRADAEAKIRKDADIVNANAVANGQKIAETAEDVARLVAASNAKYSDKAVDDRASQLNLALELEKANAQEQTGLYNERIKQLDLYHSKFGLSDDAFYSGRAGARAEYLQAVAQSYDKESDLVANFDNKNSKEEADSNRTLQKMFADYQKFVANMNGEASLDGVSILADQKKAYDQMVDALYKAGQASLKSIEAQIAKEQKHGMEIGHTKEQIDLLMQAQQDAALADLKNQAAAIEDLLTRQDLDAAARGFNEQKLSQINAEIAAREKLAGVIGANAKAQADVDADKFASKAADQAIKDWQRAGQNIASSLSDAFGKGGKAIGDMFKAYSIGMADQLRAEKELKAAQDRPDTDPMKIAEISRARQQDAQAQVRSYADMAGAAQGFFEQGTKGYQALGAASAVLHAAEIAMNLASIAPAMAAGAAQFFAQSGWGGFAGVAAMAAVVAGFGVAVAGSGSGGGVSAADVQKAQGTGSVFGDSSAKSDSVRRSIEMLEKNSSDMLPINQGMLTALQNIESSMSGLTNLVVRTDGLTAGTNMGIQEGTVGKSTGASIAAGAQLGSMAGSYFGPVGMVIGAIGGAIIGGLKSIWGKTSQSIVDSGLQYGGSVRGLQAGQGFDQYASVDTTTSSWFGLSKSTSNSVQTQGLSDELSKQFALIFTNLDKSLQAASVAMGGSAADVTKVLDNLTLESTKVSLKGLTGTALTDALNSVISKSMDEIAQAAFPQLDQFRQVGEGYAETVIRIAGDYAKLDAILAGSSTTFGATGMASIAAREHLIELAGGIDQLASQSSSFAQNFLSQAEQLAPVQKYVTDQLAAMGLQGIDTRDKFKDVVLGLANSGALATDAGAQEYAALLALSDAFAKTHAATVDLTKSEQEIADERTDLQNQLDTLTMSQAELAKKARDAIAPYNQALYDQVQAAQAAKTAQDALTTAQQATTTAQSNVLAAYNKQKSALQSIVDLQNAAADATQKQIDALKTGDLSDLTPEQKYQEAQRQFDTAAAGDAKNAAAQALLQASRDYNGSTGAYAADYAKVQSVLALQVASQRSAATIAQQQLSALDEQVGQLVDINSGVDTLNSTMVGLQDAILGLGAAFQAQALAAAAAGKPTDASGGQGLGAIDSVLTQIYKDQLGRAPDAAGLEWWEQAAAGGATYDEIVAGFQNSPEYKLLHPAAHAMGGIGSGWSIVGEQGPELVNFTQPGRVYTASQSREMLGGGGTDPKVADLLREVLNELRASNVQRGAVGLATIQKLDTVANGLSGTKRELARQSK